MARLARVEDAAAFEEGLVSISRSKSSSSYSSSSRTVDRLVDFAAALGLEGGGFLGWGAREGAAAFTGAVDFAVGLEGGKTSKSLSEEMGSSSSSSSSTVLRF